MRAKIEPRYRQNGPDGALFHVTKEEIFIQLSDKIKKFSVEQSIDDLNKNPVKNLPKLLDWADTFCKGAFENQRRAIRKACMDPTDAHYPMVQHMLNDIDPRCSRPRL